jgi:hypothetical protein
MKKHSIHANNILVKFHDWTLTCSRNCSQPCIHTTTTLLEDLLIKAAHNLKY